MKDGDPFEAVMWREGNHPFVSVTACWSNPLDCSPTFRPRFVLTPKLRGPLARSSAATSANVVHPTGHHARPPAGKLPAAPAVVERPLAVCVELSRCPALTAVGMQGSSRALIVAVPAG